MVQYDGSGSDCCQVCSLDSKIYGCMEGVTHCFPEASDFAEVYYKIPRHCHNHYSCQGAAPKVCEKNPKSNLGKTSCLFIIKSQRH